MYFVKKQQGLTFISWLVILSIAGFLLLIGIKITPVYLENYAVKSILETIKNDPLAARKSVRELRENILSRLDINHIRYVNKEHITIKRKKGLTRVQITYEERRHVIYNVFLVMTFDDFVELKSN
jgi:hypothetical protein